jgi:hypothetical protein
MGQHFYDWFDKKWVSKPPPPAKRVPGTQLRRRVRRDLIERFIDNMQYGHDNAVIQMYELLLLRAYCQADSELMEEFGEQIAAMSLEDPIREKSSREP